MFGSLFIGRNVNGCYIFWRIIWKKGFLNVFKSYRLINYIILILEIDGNNIMNDGNKGIFIRVFIEM